ncbi:unnamed protein product, partial [Arabidopsis halleri]
DHPSSGEQILRTGLIQQHTLTSSTYQCSALCVQSEAAWF